MTTISAREGRTISMAIPRFWSQLVGASAMKSIRGHLNDLQVLKTHRTNAQMKSNSEMGRTGTDLITYIYRLSPRRLLKPW